MEHRPTRSLALAALAVLTTVACQPAGTGPASPAVDAVSEAATRASASAPAPGRAAAEVLATLTVKGRAPQTGYDRDEFGPTWSDVDRNGCDTRNDVLARDLSRKTFEAGTHDCVVVRGTLADPYTAQTIEFVKGDGSSVDIDHVVALGNSWQTGSFAWDEARRTAFANDPLNLLAVDYSANRQKGDADAATWLPPNRAARCGYAARQIAVKAAYGLWVTRAEHDALQRVLDTCPGEPVPPPAAVDAPAGTSTAQPYADCAAARAAGAAPLHRGDPGWSGAMDGDGDGTACE
ncbi:GmrSD restriction endonuclease domain-containing protein [Modestobacter marinus]|uniref:GmrSD restriction endonuclease domain-containing protein n=1 Tax=Modestobacter marinus TaxID=477641 RepID=UPI0027DF03F4|nr:DUF1524 domain-containing protein [Modestobacter marinus]